MSRHFRIYIMIDDAQDALLRRDFAAADRIRNAAYASGSDMALLAGNRIGQMIAEARGKLPFAPVADLTGRNA